MQVRIKKVDLIDLIIILNKIALDGGYPLIYNRLASYLAADLLEQLKQQEQWRFKY